MSPAQVPGRLWRRFYRSARWNGLTARHATAEALRMWILKYGDDESKAATREEVGLKPKRSD